MKNISVVIPVFNCEKFIERSVKSALAQKQVAEVIIVDDGSTDNTINICLQLTTKFSEVKFFQHEGKINLGAGITRNVGIQKAHYEFIAFLDADDYFLPNRFDVALQVLNTFPNADGVYECLGIEFENVETQLNWNKRFSHQNTTIREKIEPKDLFFEMAPIGKKGWFSCDALLIKKTIFKKCGYFTHLRLSQDTELFLKMAITSNLYPGEIVKPVSIRYVHSNNRITTSAENNYLNRIQLWEQLLFWSKENKIKMKYKNAFAKQYVKTILVCMRYQTGFFNKIRFFSKHILNKTIFNSFF